MSHRSKSTEGMVLVSLIASTSLGGCTTSPSAPNLGGIYNKAAQETSHNRNPVVVMPGILGSKLIDEESQRDVWGAFSGNYANPEKADGARLLALPMRMGAPLSELDDTVVANGVLDQLEVSIFGLNIQLNAYLNILGTLGVGGYRDSLLGESGAIDYGPGHYTCFQYAYDWRLDISQNARAFGAQIRKASRIAQEGMKLKTPPKVDVVAHSMGGLLLRYYLRYGDQPLPEDGSLPELTWAGAELIDHAILIATPNAGSAESLLQLVDGIRFAPFFPKFEAALLGTMPSLYQLLPRPRHGAYVDSKTGQPLGDEMYDADFWSEMNWGLADPDQDAMLVKLLPGVDDEGERRRIALDHLQKCLSVAQQFHAAIDVPATPPPGLHLHLFAGDADSTVSVLAINTTTGDVRVKAHAPGDGTVLRTSAIMDERVGQTWVPRVQSPIEWRTVQFIFRDHLGLTKDPQFTDNVLYLLLEQPRDH
ncbi:MAG: hypothetical protein O7G85_13800 [Planctomycetota bacterium]|nr:hypothetical protein [Planctomycetota bacterium]